MAQAMAALQQLTASRVRMGLGYAKAFEMVPPAEWSALVAEWSREAGDIHSGFTTAEAVLLARIATRRPDLSDPEAVDLDDPEVQAANREMEPIFEAVGQRAYAEGWAMGAAAQARPERFDFGRCARCTKTSYASHSESL